MKRILCSFIAEPDQLEKRKATAIAVIASYCGVIARHLVNASPLKIKTYELLQLLQLLRPSRVRALRQ